MPTHSSSVQQARQALGARLREIRVDAGLTALDLSRLMGRHSSKISRIELGTVAPSAADIRVWCAFCEAPDRMEELVSQLRAVESMWTEWRQIDGLGLRRAHEARASVWERTKRYRAYSSWLIPGVLQTRGYTAAILRAIANRRGLSDNVDEVVDVRVAGQARLHAGGNTFAVLIEEHVLRAGVCGADVMVGQLKHLLACGSLASVSLGILPSKPGRGNAWPVEDFWIFEQAQVNVELVSGWLTITQPHEIAMYEAAFTELAKVAVFGAEARRLINAAIEVLTA